MKRHIWVFRILFLIFILGFLYINNNYVSLSRIDINKEKPKLQDPIQVLHLSDLHGKIFSTNQRKLLLMFDRLDYDVVVMTGDMIDKNTKDFKANEPLLTYFQEKNKPVLFVSGNHEGANPLYRDFQSLLNDYDVLNLDNSAYKMEFNNRSDVVAFIGLSDPNVKNFNESFSIVSEYIDSSKELADITIMLSHRPSLAKNFAGRVDVVLSGHSHGGQFQLPFIGGVISPEDGFLPKYDAGLFLINEEEQEGDVAYHTFMYVNRGLGNSVIPIRLFNFPEVALLTIY